MVAAKRVDAHEAVPFPSLEVLCHRPEPGDLCYMAINTVMLCHVCDTKISDMGLA